MKAAQLLPGELSHELIRTAPSFKMKDSQAFPRIPRINKNPRLVDLEPFPAAVMSCANDNAIDISSVLYQAKDKEEEGS